MSSSIHNRETKRLEKTFKDFMQDNKPKFDHIDSTNAEIEKELTTIKRNVYEYLKKTCSYQFKWLEEHGTVYFNENGINVHVNENPDGISADAILGELDSCASKNDQGLRDFFDQANSKKSYIIKDNQRCINSCAFRSEDKTDSELQNGIKKCFLQSFEETERLLTTIQDKLNDVKKSMDLV
jgi:hypothetical protein